MHNIKLLRENISDFKKKLSNRNFDFNEKEFEDFDKQNRKLISEKEKLEQEKKILSKSKDKSNFDKSKKISEEIKKLSDEQIVIQNMIRIREISVIFNFKDVFDRSSELCHLLTRRNEDVCEMERINNCGRSLLRHIEALHD